MTKNPENENEDDQKALDKIMGVRMCPMRSATKKIDCVQSDCQFWTGYKIQTEYGEGTTFNCAYPLMSESMHYVANNLFLLRQVLGTIRAGLPVQPLPTAAHYKESLSKEDMVNYLQGYDELTVASTPDGINITGWINDETKRKEAIAWMKQQGGRFYREPTKFWFIKTKKEG